MTKRLLALVGLAVLFGATPAQAQFTSPTWCFDFDSGSPLASTVGSITLTDHGTVGSTTGRSGQAATFNGSTQWLSAADSAALSVSDANFSFGMIVNFQTTTGAQTIATKDDGFPPYVIYYNNAGGVDDLTFSAYFNNLAVVSPGVTTGWHFILGVYDTDADQIGISYDGGAFTYTALGGFRPSDDTADFLIGHSVMGGDYFTGYVDTLAMWKGTKLSDANATSFYASGNGLSCTQIQAGGGGGGGSAPTLSLLGVGK